MVDIATIRAEYMRAGLAEADLAASPFDQFALWLDEAIAAQVAEPTAMSLATASADGAPSARIVLLKGFDARGFVFYTNYDSAKGRELAANPRAALTFFWPDLERQVRIAGGASRVSRDESEAYFRSRPEGSQIGAWASSQSTPIRSRAALEEKYAELAERFADKPVPLPPFWGGYRVSPVTIEFWQGRPSRLHDRLRYTRVDAEDWTIERLSP